LTSPKYYIDFENFICIKKYRVALFFQLQILERFPLEKILFQQKQYLEEQKKFRVGNYNKTAPI